MASDASKNHSDSQTADPPAFTPGAGPTTSLAPPPNYYDRASADQQYIDTSRQAPEYFFYKGSGFSSKARLHCPTTGHSYRLVADFHGRKESRLQLYTDPTSDNKQSSCLGSVTFPSTHNNFQLHTSGAIGTIAPAELTQVKARIGNPHPTSYHFKLPAAGGEAAKAVVWTTFGGMKSSSFGYRLTEEYYNTPIATFYLVSKEKHQAVLQWQIAPRDDREELMVLLSFVGAMARLKLKGRDDLRDWPSGRWGAFWFMAVLGTAAVAS